MQAVAQPSWRELCGDSKAREIEGLARRHADEADITNPSQAFRPPASVGVSYWQQVLDSAAWSVYGIAFHKRIERRKRKELHTP